jgi:hypothetical protein
MKKRSGIMYKVIMKNVSMVILLIVCCISTVSALPPDEPTNPSPSDNELGIDLNPVLSVDVTDPDGDPMDVTFYDEFNNVIGTDTSVASGGTASVTWLGLTQATYYSWYAEASDGGDSTLSQTWTFRTTGAAAFPFSEGFESGSLVSSYWITNSTGSGQIQVSTLNTPHGGNYHVLMDAFLSDSLNELILEIDLTGQTDVMLEFYHKEFNDEYDNMPEYFTGSVNADGVAVSTDGINWYKIVDLSLGS